MTVKTGAENVNPNMTEALRTLAPVIEHLAERVGGDYTARALISALSQVVVQCSADGEVNRNLQKAAASLVRTGKAFAALSAADLRRMKTDPGTNG